MDIRKPAALAVLAVIALVVVIVVATSIQAWRERPNQTVVNQGPANRPMDPQGPATPPE